MERIQNEYILEKYEPMTKKYWQRNKKPNINLLDCPFAIDRQLEDQKYLINQNKNPRGLEPGKNDKPRSIKIAAKIGVGNSINTKAKVVNKIVREASGVHNYTLVPPIVEKKNEKIIIDPDTHPLMKPYREQSNTNPVMCSFGHRPKSASRTFHPGTMKIRLKKGEIAQTAPTGRNGFGLPPSILSKLLHAPKISHPGEEFDDTKSNTLYDPHELFLPNDDLFNNTNGNSNVNNNKKSKKNNDNNLLQSENLKIGEHAWSTTLPHIDQDNEDNQNKQYNKSPKKHPHKNSTLNNEIIQNEIESKWNNHFHVIERLSNEKFELRKSGIAELKLLPLKERLTRFAAISVRDSAPQPFCQEKKLTDSFLLNGIATDPLDLYRLSNNTLQHKPLNTVIPYNKIDNPFYDAEVEADLKFIQSEYQKKEERKLKKLKKKMLKSALESIPHVEYHPDDVVIEMAHINESQDDNGNNSVISKEGEEKDEIKFNINLEDSIIEQNNSRYNVVEQNFRNESNSNENIKSIKTKKNKEKNNNIIIKKEVENDKDNEINSKQKQKQKKEEVQLKKLTNNDRINEKIHKFENIYKLTINSLDETEVKKFYPKKTSKSKQENNEQISTPIIQDESDKIYTHVMSSFEDYFKHEKEKELLQEQWKKEREEMEEKERKKLLQFQTEMDRNRNRESGEYNDNENNEDNENNYENDGEGEYHRNQLNQRQSMGMMGDNNDNEENNDDEERYDDSELFESNYRHEIEGQKSLGGSNVYDDSEGD